MHQGSCLYWKRFRNNGGFNVRGPLALCEGAILKLGTKIYGPTTVGPYSKVGGEVNNSVISEYSNKGHDGLATLLLESGAILGPIRILPI